MMTNPKSTATLRKSCPSSLPTETKQSTVKKANPLASFSPKSSTTSAIHS